MSGKGVSGRQRQSAVPGDERITESHWDKRCDAERFSRMLRRIIDSCNPVHYYRFLTVKETDRRQIKIKKKEQKKKQDIRKEKKKQKARYALLLTKQTERVARRDINFR